MKKYKIRLRDKYFVVTPRCHWQPCDFTQRCPRHCLSVILFLLYLVNNLFNKKFVKYILSDWFSANHDSAQLDSALSRTALRAVYDGTFSAALDNIQFDSALSRTALRAVQWQYVQRCFGQHSAWLSAVSTRQLWRTLKCKSMNSQQFAKLFEFWDWNMPTAQTKLYDTK